MECKVINNLHLELQFTNTLNETSEVVAVCCVQSESCYRRGCQMQAQDSRFQVWKDCVKILKSTEMLTQVALYLFNLMSLCYFGRDTVACEGI